MKTNQTLSLELAYADQVPSIVLLEIYAEVGKEKGRQVIQRLGYDFK